MQAGHLLARFSDVLDFWFGTPDSPSRGRPRKAWFAKDAAFDAEIRNRFGAVHEAAARGELDAWSRTPFASLALIIVLDQFARNLFRDDARAFACDRAALALAREALARGYERAMRPIERVFLYLPFEHAENLAAQRRSLALFDSLAAFPDCASAIEYARRHYEIVARFGRFPHRNAVLGRAPTPEEAEFLKRPGSRF